MLFAARKSSGTGAFPALVIATVVAVHPLPFAYAADPGGSAERARQGDFDGSDSVRCAQIRGQEMGSCTADVARGEAGEATVVVTFANGFSRTLFFEDGAFTRANATMSGVGTDTEWRAEDDLLLIRVDDQRYELPSALVFGE